MSSAHATQKMEKSAKRPAYNWARNFDAFEEEAEAAGLVKKFAHDVGEIIEDGKIKHVESLPMCGAENYIVYSGTDVVAVLRDRDELFAHVYRLAQHHLGKVHGKPHPDDLELSTTYKSVKIDLQFENEISWIIYLRAKAGTVAKRD
ncbi:hypothetical protein PG988_006134 [Apiospora saccharicola]